MTKGLEKLEGLEAGDTVTVKCVVDKQDEMYGLKKGVLFEQITEIVSVEKKPEPLVGYVNVYKDCMTLWETKELANDASASWSLFTTLKITANLATGEYSIEEVKE